MAIRSTTQVDLDADTRAEVETMASAFGFPDNSCIYCRDTGETLRYYNGVLTLDNINSFVSAIVGLNKVVRNKTKVVKSLADFPAPVASVITLEDNFSYEINGSVDIGTNRIVCGIRNSIQGIVMIAGQIGVAGGAVAGGVGTAQAIPVTSVITMGGSGGAGTTSADFAGGLFTAIADSYLSEQRPATPPAGTTGHGSGGIILSKPLFFFGGGGGSSSNTATGGNGGNGAYGSGGGGGGGTTGGRGGGGGTGIVIITSW